MSNIDNENIEFQAFLEELRKAYDKVEIELFKRCAETRGLYFSRTINNAFLN